MAFRKATTASPQPYEVPSTGEWEGNDGSWSTFSIRIGKPGQDFRIFPSTAGSETIVPLRGGCLDTDPSSCPSLRGVQPVNGIPSGGFDVSKSESWKLIGTYTLDLDSNLGFTAGALYGNDTVTLGWLSDTGPEPLAVENQTVAGIQSKQWFMGILGLNTRPNSFTSDQAPIPSLLMVLRNRTLIPSLSYSYTAGISYSDQKSTGSLVLGGFDRARIASPGAIITFGIDDYIAPVAGVLSINAIDTLQGVISLTDAGGFLAAIDSSVPDMWLPRSVCDAFQIAFGLTYDAISDRYLINDTTHTKLKNQSPTVTITLGQTVSDSGEGNTASIELPYAAFDLQASWPIFNTSTNYFPIRRAENASQYTLGRVLLQEAHLIVDFERKNFTISKASFPDSSTPKQIVKITPLTGSGISHRRLSGGSIAGIAIGVVVVLVVLVASVMVYHRKRRNHLSQDIPLSQMDEKHIQMDQNSSAPTEMPAMNMPEMSSKEPVSDAYLSDRYELAPNTSPVELQSTTRSQSRADHSEVAENNGGGDNVSRNG